MYAFVVFVGLALALAVVSGVLDEILPIKAPRALSTTVTVGKQRKSVTLRLRARLHTGRVLETTRTYRACKATR